MEFMGSVVCVLCGVGHRILRSGKLAVSCNGYVTTVKTLFTPISIDPRPRGTPPPYPCTPVPPYPYPDPCREGSRGTGGVREGSSRGPGGVQGYGRGVRGYSTVPLGQGSMEKIELN